MYIFTNPKYSELQPFIQHLTDPQWFADNGETLHNGRNILKKFDVGGLHLVVKSYGRPSPINRLIYCTLRKSKALRAYSHAQRLRQMGIDSPEEVAVIENRRFCILRSSFFVSLCSDYRSLYPITDLFVQTPEAKAILDALAVFLFGVHERGVLHNDLNIGNILYRKNADDTYSFQLIDTNRMEFHRALSMRQRLNNLRRLSCEVPAYLYILQQYANCTRANPSSVQLKGAVMRLLFESRQRIKYALKAKAKTKSK